MKFYGENLIVHYSVVVENSVSCEIGKILALWWINVNSSYLLLLDWRVI